ncbi:ABC transporter substrate-binding protein [Solidesulfovibrio sp.]|uniref:ABC transporter substrate-binding protein n=1 Tax=Solidesulfovibrio sp. TaxID=2910990 RepID=UPI0026385BFB|nr:ABC transporter substrate-binding protein [Solidesulfovibrio sp.]
MRRRPRLAAVLALVSALCFAHGPASARQAAPEVRLGLVATFSGEGFRTGRDALEAARYAVEAANAAGVPSMGGKPCRVTLYPLDDKDSPEQAARAVRELVAHKHVTAIIGPYPSGLANAAAVAADELGVPLVAPAATAAVVTAGRPHVFRIPFTDAFQGLVLGRLASRELGLARVAVVANRDSLSSTSLARAFVEAFTACGGAAGLFTYADRDRDFGPLMTKVLAEKPQALFFPNATKESILLALAARKAGFSGTLIGGDAWDGREVSGLAAFDGAYFVDHWREGSPGGRSRAYVAAFKQARKRAPTEIGALTQDAVDVVLAAVARAGSTDREAVTRALIELPPHDGVTGTFDFVDDGNPVKSLCVTRVTDGGTRQESRVLPPPDPCGK